MRAALAALAAVASIASAQVLRPFPPPERTTWKPECCRTIPHRNAVMGSRTLWRTPHGDAVNSDEVPQALAPELALDWVVETDKYFAMSGAFDGSGNYYISPLWPGEDVFLLALDGKTGARRWVVPGGKVSAGGSPIVADDPEHPGQQIIYATSYSEALAVRPDGTVVWRKPTGLIDPPPGTPIIPNLGSFVSFGPNYIPTADALVTITGDGYVILNDRRTGDLLLEQPYQLPGEKAPDIPPVTLPPSAVQILNDELLPLMGGRPLGAGLQEIISILLGASIENANFFAVDQRSGRLFVAATAPDAYDGVVDGISRYGALYGLDVDTSHGRPYRMVLHCGVYFEGGSASSPSLDQNGQRVYVGDGFGNLIAVDNECHEVWRLAMPQQIVGSVGVASDNHELYVISGRNLIKVVDLGTSGQTVWQSTLDMYSVTQPGTGNFNLLTPGIGADGVYIQAGYGAIGGQPGAETYRPFKTGVGQLDRATGRMRWFVEGPEESVATTNIAPDGSLVIPHSPVRRAIARATMPNATGPLMGGISRFVTVRHDLLVRDATCAGADRAANAFANQQNYPEGARADTAQIRTLVAQSRTVANQGVSAGAVTAAEATTLARYLDRADASLRLSGRLDATSAILGNACGFFPTAAVGVLVNGSADGAEIDTRRDPIVSVALLTEPTFDATKVDPDKVCFGDAGQAADRNCHALRGSRFVSTVDVDGDGDLDLLLHFTLAGSGIRCGDTQACVDGPNFARCLAVTVHGPSCPDRAAQVKALK